MARMSLPAIASGEAGLSHYLAEIRKFPMLAPDEEYMLAKAYKEHGDRDAASKLVRTIGREGAGPGEYREPTITANDRWIVMHDYQLARVTLFRRDGTVSASFPATCCAGGLSPSVDDRGRIATPAFTAGRTWWVRR